MAFETPQNSRTAVDRAGRTLLSPDASDETIARAYSVLSNWRSAHAFPLNTMTMDLRQKVDRVHKGALVVQRLKRARSILAKLNREPSMRLSQMQDIGGCRAVVNDIIDVERLRELFNRGRSLHELFDEADYITSPKSSGYRSVHLIYRFRSRSRSEFNGLLMEVQLRTRLQHAWATAVETVGAVLGQALKASEGETAWLNFFQTAGSAFARLERTPVVPDGPASSGQLARLLSSQLRNLDVRRKLSAYRAALKMTEQKQVRGAAYFLLVLRPDTPKLEIFSYTRRNMDRAYRDYQRLEQALPLFPNERQMSLFPELNDYSGAQAVLIGADSLKSIRDSFPNYYLDTEAFLKALDSFIHRFRRSRKRSAVQLGRHL